MELKGEGTFRVEFLKFRKPLRNCYSFELANIKYELQEGAEGVLLLVPLMRLTDGLGEHIEELLNST